MEDLKNFFFDNKKLLYSQYYLFLLILLILFQFLVFSCTLRYNCRIVLGPPVCCKGPINSCMSVCVCMRVCPSETVVAQNPFISFSEITHNNIWSVLEKTGKDEFLIKFQFCPKIGLMGPKWPIVRLFWG